MFVLAERLGMTVYELERRMPASDLFEWLEFYKQPEQSSAPEILSAFGLK